MPARRLLALTISCVTSALLLSSFAGAASAQVTIGELAPEAVPFAYCLNGDYDGTQTGVAASVYTVPTPGVITSWSTKAAAGSGQQLTFKVYRPLGNGEYLVVGHDGPRALTPSTTNTFATDIPVQAGDIIGNVDVNADAVPTACLFETGNPLDTAWYAEGNAADGAITFIEGEEEGVRENETATLLPPPTISSLGATSGSTSGGTSVVISGANLAEVKGVSFGATAASFVVNSEGEITATSPAGSGEVAVAVTTVAGTATSAQKFAYVAPVAPVVCKVPNLKGKKLSGAKKSLRKAHCAIGKVSKKKGVTAKKGKVVKQGKKAGKTLAAGTKVSVKLG